MGSSYLLPTLESLPNANKGPLKLTAESEDFIDVYSGQKKDPTGTLNTACPTALNFALAPVA